MADEVKKAAIQYLNNAVRSCKSDEDYLKLVGKLLPKNTTKKKLFEKLGLEPEEEIKEPSNPPDDGKDEAGSDED